MMKYDRGVMKYSYTHSNINKTAITTTGFNFRTVLLHLFKN